MSLLLIICQGSDYHWVCVAKIGALVSNPPSYVYEHDRAQNAQKRSKFRQVLSTLRIRKSPLRLVHLYEETVIHLDLMSFFTRNRI